ncbi:MAG: DUF2784 domain-containing protein [Mycobacterium sp.]
MGNFYAIVVAVTAATHFAFVGYGVLGGFLALRWPRTIWLHVPVVIWCVAIEVVDFVCPLTWLERWARTKAGMAPLAPTGFIDHYITGVWYPVSATNLVLAVVLLVVLTSWILFARKVRRRSGPPTTARTDVLSARRNVQ